MHRSIEVGDVDSVGDGFERYEDTCQRASYNLRQKIYENGEDSAPGSEQL